VFAARTGPPLYRIGGLQLEHTCGSIIGLTRPLSVTSDDPTTRAAPAPVAQTTAARTINEPISSRSRSRDR
jgi:hypothetical protein